MPARHGAAKVAAVRPARPGPCPEAAACGAPATAPSPTHIQSVLDLPEQGVNSGDEHVQPALVEVPLEPGELVAEIPMIPGHILGTLL
jgi:hypothetical protein